MDDRAQPHRSHRLGGIALAGYVPAHPRRARRVRDPRRRFRARGLRQIAAPGTGLETGSAHVRIHVHGRVVPEFGRRPGASGWLLEPTRRPSRTAEDPPCPGGSAQLPAPSHVGHAGTRTGPWPLGHSLELARRRLVGRKRDGDRLYRGRGDPVHSPDRLGPGQGQAMSHDPSSTGMATMVQVESQDLSALGNRAAIAMCGTDTSYRSFLAACKTILEGLHDDVEQVRIYLLDPVDRMLREEAVVDDFGGQEGSDLIPLYQLSEEITNKLVSSQHHMGDQWEILVPLPVDTQIAGVLALVSFQKFPPHLEERILRLGRSLALGALYVRKSREAERSMLLLKAVTDTSAKLQGLEGRNILLENFVTTAVEAFGFDRATIFVFDDDGVKVKSALCARAGFGVFPLPEIAGL